MKKVITYVQSVGPRSWALLLGGFVCIALGVALMVRANIGLSPWDMLHQGISRQTGIPLGMVTILVGLPIMIGWLPLRERPGIGTLLNVFLIGLILDGLLPLLPTITWLPAQIIQMLLGVIVLGIGVGLYLSAGLGAGPRDGLMMGLVRHTGLSVRLIRTCMELAVLGAGWWLGGSIGVGTLAFAVGVGPMIQVTMRLIQADARRDRSDAHLPSEQTPL